MAKDLIDFFNLADQGIIKSKSEVAGTSIFYGFAENLSVLTANPKWLIARETVSGPLGDLEWASDGFDQIYDDRATLFDPPVFRNDNSILFRGSNQKLQFLSHINLLDFTGLTPLTFSFWIRTGKAGEQAIISKQASGNGQGWRVTMQSNTTRLHFSDGSASTRLELRSANLSLADDNWHHIVWIITSAATPVAGNFNLIVDGDDETANVTVSADNFNTSAVSSALPLIGVRDSNALDTDAFVDEVSIHTSAITVVQAQALCNLGGPNTPGDLINAGPDPANLLLWSRMGDNDTFPNITNLGTGGTELAMTMSSEMQASDIVGEVPP